MIPMIHNGSKFYFSRENGEGIWTNSRCIVCPVALSSELSQIARTSGLSEPGDFNTWLPSEKKEKTAAKSKRISVGKTSKTAIKIKIR